MSGHPRACGAYVEIRHQELLIGGYGGSVNGLPRHHRCLLTVGCFAAAGTIARYATLSMLLAAAFGGYVGARGALRIPSSYLRIGMSVLNFLITAVFFWIRFSPRGVRPLTT